MAMTTCKECGGPISTSAIACPTLLLVIIALIAIAVAGRADRAGFRLICQVGFYGTRRG
jgi:hypothetical protein